MLEALRSPSGRFVFGGVASTVLILTMWLVEPGMLAISPAILAPIWISLLGTERFKEHPRLLRWLLVLGTATLLAGVVAN